MNQAGQGFKHVTRGGLRFDRCPKAWIRDEAQSAGVFLSDFVFLDRYKIMPETGARLDQCPRFLESVDVIESTKLEIQEAHRKRAENKHARETQKRGRGGR